MPESEVATHIRHVLRGLYLRMGMPAPEAENIAAAAVAELRKEIGGASIYLSKRPTLVDMAALRPEVERLRGEGKSWREVSAALGIPCSSAWRLLAGRKG